MPRIDTAGGLPPSDRSAPAPRRQATGARPVPPPTFGVIGTARPLYGPSPYSTQNLWQARHERWRNLFTSGIRGNLLRYWFLYRSMDTGASIGPGEEWRDQTVIPEAFKIIEARLARLTLGMFGRRDWMAVKGVERSDAQVEELVRRLLEVKLGEIGRDSEDGDGLIVRAIEGLRYEQIVGHAWWRLWWRSRYDRRRAPMLVFEDESEEPTWKEVELLETVYDGLDFAWLPLDSIACNLTGPRTWTIEKVRTTIEALAAEDAEWRARTGRPLYHNLAAARATAEQHDSTEEPRDTERWPLDDTREREPSWAIGEKPVTLWLCWDHRRRTLTKMVNGQVVIAHGRAPTPDGRGPYWATKAVPVPNRPYGDSILNWVGPLVQYQTRIARARMDEILLNVWQQYVIRSGAIAADQLLFRPGGHVTVEAEPGEPLDRAFAILPRRPVFQEAWTEESYRQRMAESTAATDAVQMGAEATTKSRDVTATEIQQRILQGGARHQVDILYHQVAFMRPLLRRAFDLVRQHMTPAQVERILGEPLSLAAITGGIDLKIGGGLYEMTREERLTNIQTWLQLAASPAFAPLIEPRTILEDFARWSGETDPDRYLKKEGQENMALAAQAGPGPASQPGQSMPGLQAIAQAMANRAPGQAPAPPPTEAVEL